MDNVIYEILAINVLWVLFLQCVLFRFTPVEKRSTVLLWIITVSGGLGFVCAGGHVKLGAAEIVLTLLTYLLVAYGYIQSIYAPVESSITLRLLTEIAAQSGTGITKKELGAVYNTAGIVKKRLACLTAVHELAYEHGGYKKTAHYSVFSLRESAGVVFQWLFPV